MKILVLPSTLTHLCFFLKRKHKCSPIELTLSLLFVLCSHPSPPHPNFLFIKRKKKYHVAGTEHHYSFLAGNFKLQHSSLINTRPILDVIYSTLSLKVQRIGFGLFLSLTTRLSPSTLTTRPIVYVRNSTFTLAVQGSDCGLRIISFFPPRRLPFVF